MLTSALSLLLAPARQVQAIDADERAMRAGGHRQAGDGRQCVPGRHQGDGQAAVAESALRGDPTGANEGHEQDSPAKGAGDAHEPRAEQRGPGFGGAGPGPLLHVPLLLRRSRIVGGRFLPRSRVPSIFVAAVVIARGPTTSTASAPAIGPPPSSQVPRDITLYC